jgi:hypothetical protein
MARSVPLSRSMLRVGGGSAFFVRPREFFCDFCAFSRRELLVVRIEMSKLPDVRKHLARAGSQGEQVRRLPICKRWDLPDLL